MKKLLLSALVAMSLFGSVASADVNLKSCVGCHGVSFEKKALGKSKVVSDMNTTEIATALKGYKAGTYGGPMKGLMRGQIIKYDNETILTIAKQITQQ